MKIFTGGKNKIKESAIDQFETVDKFAKAFPEKWFRSWIHNVLHPDTNPTISSLTKICDTLGLEIVIRQKKVA